MKALWRVEYKGGGLTKVLRVHGKHRMEHKKLGLSGAVPSSVQIGPS